MGKEAPKTTTIARQRMDVRGPLDSLDTAHIPRKDNHYIFQKELTHDVLSEIRHNERILLTGHTGTGKTSMVQQIAARIRQPVLRVNLNGQATIGDFVGLWTLKGGDTVWVDGALPMAMRRGYWVILDEIDYAEPHILACLNSVLEEDGILTLKEKGHEVIHPHKHFRLFSTANTVGVMQDFRTLYQGTNLLNEAFVDRWHVHLVDYPSVAQESLIVRKKFPSIEKDTVERMVKCAHMSREAFRREELTCTFSTRRLLSWGEAMSRLKLEKKPTTAAAKAVMPKITVDNAAVIEKLMGRVFGAEGTEETAGE